MRDDDGLELFFVSPQLRESAAALVREALDRSSCQHEWSPLLCQAHPEMAWCDLCAQAHLLDHHTPLDTTCSQCGGGGDIRPGWVGVGEFTVLVWLCGRCRGART